MNSKRVIYFKRKLPTVAVLWITIILSSCEELIDLSPYSQIDENTAFTTPSLIDLSVTGMYQAAQRGIYTGTGRGYPWGAAFVQQGDVRGEDVVNIFTFYTQSYTSTYSTTSLNNGYWWEDSYRLINRCNIVIEGVQEAADNGIITQDLANRYKGEALLFRAITHFELLIHFSMPYLHTADASHRGIPYRESPFTTKAAIAEGKKLGRNTVTECYGKVLADLDMAEQYLPKKSERGSVKEGVVRFTKQAAAAFKTRVYLHKYDWLNVISEGSKFLTGGVYAGSYSLNANPGGPFSDNYGNGESIFSIENSATNNPTANGALAAMYKRRLLVCVSPVIWRDPLWLANDKRRSVTTESTIAGPEMIYNNGGRMYTNKYKDITNYTDAAPLIRYAEVLLNLSEAYARNNDMVNGLLFLNAVRNRSLADPVSQAYSSGNFADTKALVGTILKERRIEFLMEGRRWPDIHRLQFCPFFPIDGIPAKLANSLPSASAFSLGTAYTGPFGIASIPYSNYRFLWPIPQWEMDANPGLAGQQNPGW